MALEQDWVRARTHTPAAFFVVAGDPNAAPGSPAGELGSEVANLSNFHEVDLAQLPGYEFLPGYPVTENLKLPGNLLLPGCPVFARLHLPGNLPG